MAGDCFLDMADVDAVSVVRSVLWVFSQASRWNNCIYLMNTDVPDARQIQRKSSEGEHTTTNFTI